MSRMTITDAPRQDGGFDFEARGDGRKLIESHDNAIILCGPRDTGKTLSACWKAHLLCLKYPKTQGAIVRRTYKSMPGTVLTTFERVIAGHGVRPYGGAYVTRYIYPNGSVVWVASMDKPERALSGERDFIYVCQTEELTEDQWQTLASCCTGRSAVVPYPGIFGDCNPSSQRHWIRNQAREGRLTLLNMTHKDNPQLYDAAGEITAEGTRRIGALEKMLTGIRRKRLLLGQWASAEGAVFEDFDSTPGGPHVQVRDPRDFRKFFLAMDEGGTNPQVDLLIGADADDRWHVFREYYETKKNESEIVAQAKCWYEDVRRKGEISVPYRLDNVTGAYTLMGAGLEIPDAMSMVKCEYAAVDEAAAGLIRSLRSVGIDARAGKGGINDGNRKISDRLRVQEFDKRTRFTVDPECNNLIDEFECYVWDTKKDLPVDANNHAISSVRYLVDVQQSSPEFEAETTARPPRSAPVNVRRRRPGPLV